MRCEFIHSFTAFLYHIFSPSNCSSCFWYRLFFPGSRLPYLLLELSHRGVHPTAPSISIPFHSGERVIKSPLTFLSTCRNNCLLFFFHSFRLLLLLLRIVCDGSMCCCCTLHTLCFLSLLYLHTTCRTHILSSRRSSILNEFRIQTQSRGQDRIDW